MPVLASNIDRKSVKYQENAKSMRHLVDALQMHTATVSQGGGEEAGGRGGVGVGGGGPHAPRSAATPTKKSPLRHGDCGF